MGSLMGRGIRGLWLKSSASKVYNISLEESYMTKFEIKSSFKPAGSQPEAIAKLVEGVRKGEKMQTLLGVTGSGKTFTMANIIQAVQKPTLVLVHNKTLAAQLYNEFKDFFPNNRVEYFVSFYDYYQPESYIPQKDQYIEKDSQINSMIERMRLSATTSLMTRNDTIIVASVSCIYGLGNPENYRNLGFNLDVGEKITRKELMSKILSIGYERNDMELLPGRFRVKGDTIDVVPSYMTNIIRFELFGDEVERISEIDKTTGDTFMSLKYYYLFPARHFVVPETTMQGAMASIRKELDARLPQLGDIEAHRLKQRTLYDLEMMEEIGFCKGIENYSAHFDGRKPGEQPFCLLDYFPKDFLFFIDESHQSIPQLHAMYEGDRMRKQNLVDYGFRLPSALDNRPLKFNETEKYLKNNTTIFVSATPAKYEKDNSSQVVEQIIRPTGLVDPPVEVKGTEGQMQEVERAIEETIKRGDRVLVTALTKKLAEEISDYFASKGIKSRYLHSEVKTLERTEIIRELRLGKFDVLVGINLLREGLDIPEVGYIAILDADKEGFLRNTRSLIQIIGRAARNSNAKVVLFADEMTDSMRAAIRETERRREIQLEYNKKHGITPKTIKKEIAEQQIILKDTKHIPKSEKKRLIPQLEKEMKQAAEKLDFELAIALRDRIAALSKEVGGGGD
jgi:excinuclease ABC subunit B